MAAPNTWADATDTAATSGSFSEFRDVPGLGDDEHPGFPADVCPEHMPDLSRHHTMLADVLKKNPRLYARLKDRRTSSGVGLAKCIKTGMDNRGHPMIKTAGLVAGDEECYETFKEIFQPVLQQRHGAEALAHAHVTNFDKGRLTTTRADTSGTYALSTQIRLARCLRGTRFPPAVTFQERREVERVVARALLELDGSLKGDYHPLVSSNSFAQKPGGMSCEEEEALRRANLVFDQPDSTTALCSGVGRHWPDARGVFVNASQTLSVWVNEEEHIRAVAARPGDDVQEAFREIADALNGISTSLERHGDGPQGFAVSERLGFLTSSLATIGTAMRVSMIVSLPLLSQSQQDLSKWCENRGLAIRSALHESGAQLPGLLEVSNCVRLGLSEVDTVNLVIESVAELVQTEIRLSKGLDGLPISAAGPQPVAAASASEAGLVVEARSETKSPSPSDLDAVAAEAFGDFFLKAVQGTDTPDDCVPEVLEQLNPQAPATAPANGNRDSDVMQAGPVTAVEEIQAAQSGKQEKKGPSKQNEEKAETLELKKLEREKADAIAGNEFMLANKIMKDIKAIKAIKAHREALLELAHKKADAIATDDFMRANRITKEIAALTAKKEAAGAEIDKHQPRQRHSLKQQLKPPNPSNMNEETRLRVKASLEIACDSGSLEAALISATGSSLCSPALDALDNLKLKARELLGRAHEAGSLFFMLADTFKDADATQEITRKGNVELSQAAVKIQAVHRGNAERRYSKEAICPASQRAPTHRCPDCPGGLEWSNYAEGVYARGWSCNNSDACGSSSATAGDWRWFCPNCLNDFCHVCKPKAEGNKLHLSYGAQGKMKLAYTIPLGVRLSKAQSAAVTSAEAQSAAVTSADPTEDPELAQAALKIQAVHRGKQSRKKSNKEAEAALPNTNPLTSGASADTIASTSILTDGALEEMRLKTRSLLVEAHVSGHLHSALEGNLESSLDFEQLRYKVKTNLESACESGALDVALQKIGSPNPLRNQPAKLPGPSGVGDSANCSQQAPCDVHLDIEMDDVKAEMRTKLKDACVSGDLAQVLDSARATSAALAPEDSADSALLIRRNLCEDFAAAGNLQAPAVAAQFSTGPQGEAAKVLLQAISNSDRRAGALKFLIKEAQQRRVEQDESIIRLEAEVASSRCDAQHLALEHGDQHRRLEEQEATTWKLQDTQRRLSDDLNMEALKQRHCMLDWDPKVASARSEATTACTMRDFASPTPRTFQNYAENGPPLALEAMPCNLRKDSLRPLMQEELDALLMPAPAGGHVTESEPTSPQDTQMRRARQRAQMESQASSAQVLEGGNPFASHSGDAPRLPQACKSATL